MPHEEFFDYEIPPFCFADRAEELLARFDKGEIPCLFYAALELRMGIEARLFQIIRSALELAQRPVTQIKEYRANVLLKRLSQINPEALNPIAVGFGIGGGPMSFMHYTPVTPKLAAYHGQLGEMLHFKFFENNEEWYYKLELSHPMYIPERKNLFSYRALLADVLEELRCATSGSLISPPSGFLSQIDTLNHTEEN